MHMPVFTLSANSQGGTGVNNCLIKADTACHIILIPIINIREVLPELREGAAKFFDEKMLEKLSGDIMNLERLNVLVLETVVSDSYFRAAEKDEDQWRLPLNKRKYFSTVPELERQDIQVSIGQRSRGRELG